MTGQFKKCIRGSVQGKNEFKYRMQGKCCRGFLKEHFHEIRTAYKLGQLICLGLDQGSPLLKIVRIFLMSLGINYA